MITIRRTISARLWVAATLAIFVSSSVHAITYKATVLHPLSGYDESVAVAIVGDWQAGDGNIRTTTLTYRRALLWNSTAESVVSLHPAGFETSSIRAMSGNTQVGSGSMPSTDNHALLWNGTADSVVDLHPATFDASLAYDVDGEYQVGGARRYNEGNTPRAMLWQGTAESAVNLHPPGTSHSEAYAISGNRQGGEVYLDYDSLPHAALWSGTADSFVDINPAGFTYSSIRAMDGNLQVGQGLGPGTSNNVHALLWSGTADSVVDLHPAGLRESYARAVLGNIQVGLGYKQDAANHALMWNGTADSVVDLHTFLADLPIAYGASQALGINSKGQIVGVAQFSPFTTHAILWTPVPEPASLVLVVGGLTMLSFVGSRGRTDRLAMRSR